MRTAREKTGGGGGRGGGREEGREMGMSECEKDGGEEMERKRGKH